MTQTTVASTDMDLSAYYQSIQTNGSLLTPGQSRRWSQAVLRTLGLNLDRKTKKQLAQTLPEEPAQDLMRAFWLVHFRDKNKPAEVFFKDAARRGGNTDAQFAKIPTTAVFHALKQFAGQDVSDKVAESLAPEIRAYWEQA